MATYIRKTIKLLPWVKLNINKTGWSVSIGPRGAKLNISKKGVYFNSSIPGTGLYNKTKVGASLLWGLGTAVLVAAVGYALGIALQNFRLFVVMLILAIPAGIAAFLISRIKTKTVTEVEEEEEEEPEPPAARRSSTTRRKTAATKKTTRSGRSTPTRADNASAKAYIGAVEQLVEKMAEAETVEDLDKAHEEILDIMYTNIKPLGVQVMGMEFKEALTAIEQEYAEGLKQLKGN